MAVVTNRFRGGAILLFCLAANLSSAVGVGAGLKPTKSFDDQTKECIDGIKQALRTPLSNPPDFASLSDVTKWLDKKLPGQIKDRFAASGRDVSISLKDWERHGMIHGPFWNMQALKELLNAQAPRFHDIGDCKIEDDLGVAYEVLQDQIFIALDLKNKPVEKVLGQLGVSDPYYVKMSFMYGVILDFANISWSDEKIAQVAKFRIAQPSEAK